MTKKDFVKDFAGYGSDTLVQDIPCEECVLGSILQDNSVFDEYRDQLTPTCFYKPQHEEIFKAICSVRERGETADLITTLAELQKHETEITPYDITRISGQGIRADIPVYVARLKDLDASRRIWLVAKKLEPIGISEHDNIESVLEEARTALNDVYSGGKKHVSTLKDALQKVYDQVNANASNNGPMTGTYTGFDFLDTKGGLQGGNLVVIAGATSQGKTSFANSITLNAINTGKKVAFYSLEMTSTELAARMTSIMSKIPSSKLLYSSLSESDISAMDKGVGRLMDYEGELYFDDRSTSNIDTILSSIRSMKYRYGIDGAVIDYLQILNVNMKNVNKEQAMGDVARRLKNLAKELGIWIIALSQLNRDNQDPVPTINRLRDSGQIAEAADVVMLVYRPEYYQRPFPQPFAQYDTKGKAMIDVCKGRNIGVGKFLCGFLAETTHFYQLDEMELVKKSDENEMPW